MGRLRGVVAGLGMQVAFFLAYLWRYPLEQPLPEAAPLFELSQQDLNDAAHRFRRYKQDMTEEQQKLFPQVKVAGKGHKQFFIKCWEGLQLLLSKVAVKGKQKSHTLCKILSHNNSKIN